MREGSVPFDIGDAAEDAFKALCSQVGIIATPPAKDRRGWDWHLNLPQVDRIDPIDAPPGLACYVQVKGHLGDDHEKPEIRLSNWQRMISDLAPWFVCVVLLDRDARTQACALVHVDEALVAMARKRIWENAAGANGPLNALRMACPWSDSDLLPTLHGSEILERVRTCIGDPRTYIDLKRGWYEDAGIERGKHRLSFKWGPDVSDQDLCDFALGKRSSLGVAAVDRAEVRFGIAIHRTTYKDVSVEIPKPPSLGRTRLKIRRSRPPRETIDLDFETLLSTSVFPFLPTEYQRVRLVAPLLSVELSRRVPQGMTAQWDFHVDDHDEVKLAAVERAAGALAAFMDSTPPEIEALLPPDQRSMKLTAPDAARVDAQPKLRELAEAACNAGRVARVFGFNPDALTVTPASLVEQADGLAMLALLYTGSSVRPELTVKNVGPECAQLTGKSIARVLAFGARLDKYFLLQCSAILGTGRTAADGVSLELADTEIRAIERVVIDTEVTPAETANELLRKMVRRATEEQERDGRLIIAQSDDPR
jgi:hypothetical protein